MWQPLQEIATLAALGEALPGLLADADLGCQSCVLYLAEDGGPRRVWARSPHAEVPGFLEPVVRLAWEESRALLVERVRKPLPNQRVFRDELSLMVVPLRAVGETFGVLYLGARKSGTYGPDHFQRLQELAGPYSAFLAAAHQQPALNRARFERDAVRLEHARLVEGLEELSRNLQRARTAGQCLTACTAAARQLIPGVVTSLAFLPETREVSLLSPYPEVFADPPTESGLLARAQRHGTILVQDVYYLTERERSAIAAPLAGGFLYVGAPQRGSFTEEHRQLLGVVATATSHALRNLDREDLSGLDPLTGLPGGAYLRHRVGEELARGRRTGRPLWLGLLDLDGARQAQDVEQLLKQACEVVDQTLPPEGLLVRYGGDEFGLLVPGQGKAEGLACAERIRQACQQALKPITVSLGVAAAPEDGQRGLDLLRSADRALMRAKAEGANRVVGAG